MRWWTTYGEAMRDWRRVFFWARHTCWMGSPFNRAKRRDLWRECRKAARTARDLMWVALDEAVRDTLAANPALTIEWSAA